MNATRFSVNCFIIAPVKVQLYRAYCSSAIASAEYLTDGAKKLIFNDINCQNMYINKEFLMKFTMY